MEVTTMMSNGTKFTYNNGKFTTGDGVLVISKLSGGRPDIEIALNDFETMKLLRFIITQLVKI